MKCKIEVNKAVQTEIVKKLLKISKICLICSIVAVIFYIVFGTIYPDSSIDTYLLMFVSIFFAVSIIVYLLIKRTVKNIEKNPFINEYEFDDEAISATSSKIDGTFLSSSKIPYTNVLKIKETENFILIYISQVAIWPVNKTTLSEEDIIFLKQKFTEKNIQIIKNK